METEARREDSGQQGSDEEDDPIHRPDRRVHATLDPVGHHSLSVGDLVRIFDTHDEAVDELGCRDNAQNDTGAAVGGYRCQGEDEPRDDDEGEPGSRRRLPPVRSS